MEWLKKMYAKKLELLGSRRFWQLTLTAALEIVKKIDKKSTTRKWWHNILIFIIGTISFFVGMMLVRFIFSLFY